MELSINECPYDKLKILIIKHSLELSWEMSLNPCEIINDGELVALIDIDFDGIFGNQTLEIHNFEVIEKNNGIGKSIIKKIIDEAEDEQREIYLYANGLRSRRFWLELGFVARNDGTGTEVLMYPSSN